MALVDFKLISAAALFLVGVFGVLLPWMRRMNVTDDRFMVWGDTFAGGVLSGADGFRRLIPSRNYPAAFVRNDERMSLTNGWYLAKIPNR